MLYVESLLKCLVLSKVSTYSKLTLKLLTLFTQSCCNSVRMGLKNESFYMVPSKEYFIWIFMIIHHNFAVNHYHPCKIFLLMCNLGNYLVCFIKIDNFICFYVPITSLAKTLLMFYVQYLFNPHFLGNCVHVKPELAFHYLECIIYKTV